MATITITCPWPPSKISPNAKRRAHWTKYRMATKQYRETCFFLTKEAVGRASFGVPTSITIGFFPPDDRHRDDDNMIGAFKAGRDGIAAALGHDDCHWRGKVRAFFNDAFRPSGQVIVQIEVEEKAA